MSTKDLIGIGFVIFASLSTQLPHMLFRHHPKFTGAQLAEKYPELAWLRFAYPVLSVLWFLIFGALPIFLIVTSTFEQFLLFSPFQSIIYIMGGAIGSLSILHGLLGLITNVCPLPRKRGRLYVYDEAMQPMALLLMAAGVFVIIIALGMIYFYVL